MGLISIIIPTYNRVKALEICLNEIVIQIQQLDRPKELEIIVSNDFENNDEFINLMKGYPLVKFTEGPHKGPASNRNYAASIAKNEWLLFIDDDCLPVSNWLESYINEILLNTYFVLEGKTIADRPQNRFDELAPTNENGGRLWSCNFAIKKNIFEKIKGFDENFPIPALEDTDLKLRVEKLYPIKFIENATVIHEWRKNNSYKNPIKLLELHKYFLLKHNHKITFLYRLKRVKILFQILSKDLVLLCKLSFKGWVCYLEKMILNFLMIFI